MAIRVAVSFTSHNRNVFIETAYKLVENLLRTTPLMRKTLPSSNPTIPSILAGSTPALAPRHVFLEDTPRPRRSPTTSPKEPHTSLERPSPQSRSEAPAKQRPESSAPDDDQVRPRTATHPSPATPFDRNETSCQPINTIPLPVGTTHIPNYNEMRQTSMKKNHAARHTSR
eukprot:CAMPEP_0113675568 /NCGR_PEP_ID=MMETSP0038_2-20120614/8098_1 /TAXON_ID=2898 /ORGANISM="Cryptomonas paramecium" /LENGTH=170 /DNA_ID=CAMNT_0000592377 /DNA_START=443 /DNA_END=956 /DNA_ORIENTATION=- /assembly_acc=CAM_ASM_000170